jgi:hypothetical protein
MSNRFNFNAQALDRTPPVRLNHVTGGTNAAVTLEGILEPAAGARP